MGLLYTRYKMFHYQNKLDSLPRSERITPPLHIRIKPTNLCNHSCWYCAYKAPHMQLGEHMVERDFIPLEKMLEIIDDCEKMGVKAITFSGGGEPLIYRYMPQTLERLADSKIKFATLSNGSNLRGKIAEIFAEFGSWVRISMDGYDDCSYSRFRDISKKDEFSRIIENMKNFKKLKGNCLLGVSFIVGEQNWHKIGEMVRLLRDIGVDSVKIAPTITSNSSEETNTYHKGFYDNVREEIAKLNEISGIEIYDSYHYQLETFKKPYSWCPYSQLMMVIGADLKIYPCHDKAYNNSAILGDISKLRFADWWAGNKEAFFKIDPSRHCDHHCVAHQHNLMLLEYLDADKEHLGFV